ncbi:MAG: multicopper oxidase domain-containing protein [Bradyrhizobium sp.]|uniref:multicopper oxidase family protein n=1 Tax=Bradyrhizobium sp. TaxID=376 RepID=UPI00271D7A7D|nr:multicopper oxidase domain-containing protein [Bradyrhizobium sp.]MDO8401697.1 multicopper oxidase domain-containing protein [Bradyrhizobium sp.]
MADRNLRLYRREFLAGLGATALAPALPAIAAAQARPSLALQAKDGVIALRAGAPETPIWTLGGPASGTALRFRRGETLEVALANALPVPTATSWRGIDGVPAAEPLAARAPLPSGAKETLVIPLRHAGTFLCDVRLLGDGQARPSGARALIVSESEPVAVDRDEVLLIEDWRLRPDGTAIAPGMDPEGTAPIYTLNGRTAFELSAFGNERLRLRFINGSQRTVLAVKLENHDLRVMAIDGQPSEPFLARNGALVLAPGGRVDAFVETRTTSSIVLHDGKQAHPIGTLAISGYVERRAPRMPAPALPSNGLPDRLDLKSAARIDLALGGPPADWVTPANFVNSAAPVFRAKAGRVVVLALTNRAELATVFHLHGHHFRLLDRLDDGWKPFWLDTLAIEPGQTQRIAFLAEYAGRWLMESVATDWAAPRLVRWYSVE